jgi:NADH dehydrogenase FAD-containing subunit
MDDPLRMVVLMVLFYLDFRKDVLPRKAEWIKQSVVGFNPDESKLTTSEGDEISYEFLVVAMGLQLNYGQVQISSRIMH